MTVSQYRRSRRSRARCFSSNETTLSWSWPIHSCSCACGVCALLLYQPSALPSRRIEDILHLSSQEVQNRRGWSSDCMKQGWPHHSIVAGACMRSRSMRSLSRFVAQTSAARHISRHLGKSNATSYITCFGAQHAGDPALLHLRTSSPTSSFNGRVDGMSTSTVYNALIRTHHITSRKKVAKLRQAATNCDVYALLRSGGCPGIMYCQGSESGVRDWVFTVQRLRYKDYQLEKKPAEMQPETSESNGAITAVNGKLEEVESVKEFGARMEGLCVWAWWRKGMGYAGND